MKNPIVIMVEWMVEWMVEFVEWMVEWMVSMVERMVERMVVNDGRMDGRMDGSLPKKSRQWNPKRESLVPILFLHLPLLKNPNRIQNTFLKS